LRGETSQAVPCAALAIDHLILNALQRAHEFERVR
jgi:hypothetical protein